MSWLDLISRNYVDEAEPADADRIAEIHQASFASPWSAEDLAAMLPTAGVLCLTAREAGPFGGRRVIGFVLARRAADEAEILSLAVEPGRRRRGHGRKLVEALMRRLFRDRIEALFLEVDETNLSALALYRSLGFKPVGKRPGYYKDKASGARAALVMRAQLR